MQYCPHANKADIAPGFFDLSQYHPYDESEASVSTVFTGRPVGDILVLWPTGKVAQ